MVLGPSERAPPTAEVYAERRAGRQRRRLGRARRPVGLRRRHRRRAACGGSGATACRWRRSACSRWPTTRSPAASAATCAGCRPGRSRSPTPAAQASNTLGSQTSSPTGSRSGATGRCTSPTRRAARSGACSSTAAAACCRTTGCDTTFTPNTLCLDNVLVQHPYLDGADGIVLDDDDNIYVAANERNAIAVVTQQGQRGRALPQRRRAPTGCATRARSSSRPARCSSAASCARRTQTARGATTSRRPPARAPRSTASPESDVEVVEAIRVDGELDPVADRHRRAGVDDDGERGAVVLGEQDVVVDGGGVDGVGERGGRAGAARRCPPRRGSRCRGARRPGRPRGCPGRA